MNDDDLGPKSSSSRSTSLTTSSGIRCDETGKLSSSSSSSHAPQQQQNLASSNGPQSSTIINLSESGRESVTIQDRESQKKTSTNKNSNRKTSNGDDRIDR